MRFQPTGKGSGVPEPGVVVGENSLKIAVHVMNLTLINADVNRDCQRYSGVAPADRTRNGAGQVVRAGHERVKRVKWFQVCGSCAHLGTMPELPQGPQTWNPFYLEHIENTPVQLSVA